MFVRHFKTRLSLAGNFEYGLLATNFFVHCHIHMYAGKALSELTQHLVQNQRDSGHFWVGLAYFDRKGLGSIPSGTIKKYK